MNTKVFLFVCFGCLTLVLPMGWSSNLVSKVDRWYWYPEEMNVASMSEAEKKAVIAEMRRRIPSSDSTDRKHYRWILIRYFGDEETMAEVVKEAQKGDSRAAVQVLSVFNYVYNPAVIPAVAELLYYPEEPAYMKGTGLRWETRPLWAASKICEIIRRRDEFTQETRAWAASARFAWEKEFHQAVRQFWEQNREAFLRKDYAAVKPLQPASAPALSASPAATNAVPQPPSTNAVPVPKPEPAATGAAASAAPKSPSCYQWPAWLVGGIVLALVAVAAVLLLRAKRNAARPR